MEELRYSDGDVEVIVLPEAGARFHRLRAFGHDLLRTPDDPDTHHRDPFDRMLVAQAIRVGAVLVTRDTAFEPYGVETLGA